MNNILCLNAGSSSLKFAVCSLPEETRLAQGAVENIGPQARIWIRNAQNQITEDRQARLMDAHDCIKAVFSALDKIDLPRPRLNIGIEPSRLAISTSANLQFPDAFIVEIGTDYSRRFELARA